VDETVQRAQWRIKEAAAELHSQNADRKGLGVLDTMGSKVDPIKRVAKTIREHL